MAVPDQVEWPDWGALEAAVRMEHYMGANEEFRLLRLAVLATWLCWAHRRSDVAGKLLKDIESFGLGTVWGNKAAVSS